MIELKITLEPADIAQRIARLQASLPERLEQERKKLAEIVLKAVKSQSPVKTGALKTSLKWTPMGKIDVLWGLEYGRYIITGTRPHVIEPKNAKALRFEINGQIVFAKRVNHPGTKANDFRKKGLEKVDHQEILSSLSAWLREQVVK